MQELLGTWRIPKLDLREQQYLSIIICLVKWKIFYHALWFFPNSLFYLSIHHLKLLDSSHKHIWAMFACSQSQKVLFRKWKGLVKFWSLLFGVCDWAPSLEFIPSNVSRFSDKATSEHGSAHRRSAAFGGYAALVQGSVHGYRSDRCDKSGTWRHFVSPDGVIIIKDFCYSALIHLKKHCVTGSIKCTYFLEAQKSLLSKASDKSKFHLRGWPCFKIARAWQCMIALSTWKTWQKKDRILSIEKFNYSDISSESTNGISNAEYIFFLSW